MTGIFQKVMCELGIEQYVSSVYHPKSQGGYRKIPLNSINNMIGTWDLENWDEGVHPLLFAVQETLGLSPLGLIFGSTVRGPLKLLNDETDVNLLEYVSKFKYSLTE